jgi:hypothetical protein
MPSIYKFAKLTGISLLSVLALSACSHDQKGAKPAPATEMKLKTAPAVSAAKITPVQSPKQIAAANAQRFVTAFGHGTLKIMHEMPGPAGMTAVIVAPSGTKTVTPTTPVALLWIMPGGDYAMEGTLLDVAGHNLSLKYREKMGIIPPVIISAPASPPVSVNAPAVSGVAPTRSAKGLRK